MFGLGFGVRKGCEWVANNMDGLDDNQRRIGCRVARVLGVAAGVLTLDIASISFDIADLAGSLTDSFGDGSIGTGTATNDLYYQDVTGAGYGSPADYAAGGPKLDQSPDGLWYPRQ